MKFLKLLSVLLASAIWRTMGIRPAGRALVRALGTNDEQVRAIAGMMLVKSGKKAKPLLQEALHRRENVSTVLTVLGSIGDPSMEQEIRRFTDDQDPQVSKAARDALDAYVIALGRAGVAIRRLEHRGRTLEWLFLQLTGPNVEPASLYAVDDTKSSSVAS